MFFFSKVSFSFFRGFHSFEIELPNDFILLYGDNGSGKTNFLEALNILCLTKSFKSVSDKDIVNERSDFYFLDAEIQNHSLRKVSCNFLKNKGKKIFHNEEPIAKFSQHLGILPCVSLIPDDSDIIKDPSKRRKWFNLLFSQWDKDYLAALQNYQNALLQRNTLLKNNSPFKELEPWTYQLCIYGKILIQKRTTYFEKLHQIFMNVYHQLGNWDDISFSYQKNYTYDDINKDLHFYEKQLKIDFQNSHTTYGAHRDDVIFQLNLQNLKYFASQGQQKTFIIALKLSEYEFLHQYGKTPLLLLDDVFEKLDTKRIQFISNYLHQNRKSQIFVTHPSSLNLDFAPYFIHMNKHEVVKL